MTNPLQHSDNAYFRHLPKKNMVVGVVVAIFKPFVYLWAGLNFIDDVSDLWRFGRLAIAVMPLPFRNPERENMCGLCDDIVGDFIAGTSGISSIPCGTACLGSKKCVEMCERVQDVSESSSEFPCVAAGFCDPVETGYIDSLAIDCKGAMFFTCQPKQYCRRKREKLKFTCELRPGIGRWVGMKNLAGRHSVALVEGLRTQLHCGEEGAGEYCIARPTGTGLIAEYVGHIISFIIAGYKSILAIESPGGDDDRQWLTFWLILCVFLYVEMFFARVVLSNVPYYYECKLVGLIWLVWKSGAETCYRKIRRFFERYGFLIDTAEEDAQDQIDIMEETGGSVVKDWLSGKGKNLKRERSSVFVPNEYWQYDDQYDTSTNSTLDTTERLAKLSKFILSPEGHRLLEESKTISEQGEVLLLERAAQVVSFQPRYLRVHLLGCIDERKGELPVMDSNGLADGYVNFSLVPSKGESYPTQGISSRTVYRKLNPFWDEELEIPLEGGKLGPDGYFQSADAIRGTTLKVYVKDADVGLWSIFLYICQCLLILGTALIFGMYIEGYSDNLTEEQQQDMIYIGTIIIIGYAVAYVMAVMKRSDDEVIGVSSVPLGILMDQKEHSLLLTLQQDKDSKKESTKKTNSVGGRGIIRIELMLSED